MSFDLTSIVFFYSLPTRGDTIGHMQGCEILGFSHRTSVLIITGMNPGGDSVFYTPHTCVSACTLR